MLWLEIYERSLFEKGTASCTSRWFIIVPMTTDRIFAVVGTVSMELSLREIIAWYLPPTAATDFGTQLRAVGLDATGIVLMVQLELVWRHQTCFWSSILFKCLWWPDLAKYRRLTQTLGELVPDCFLWTQRGRIGCDGLDQDPAHYLAMQSDSH